MPCSQFCHLLTVCFAVCCETLFKLLHLSELSMQAATSVIHLCTSLSLQVLFSAIIQHTAVMSFHSNVYKTSSSAMAERPRKACLIFTKRPASFAKSQNCNFSHTMGASGAITFLFCKHYGLVLEQ